MTALKAGELKQWKKDSGYHQRSIAETAMDRAWYASSPSRELSGHGGLGNGYLTTDLVNNALKVLYMSHHLTQV
ncbi:hypothetical protein E2P79_04910 [Aeromonas schubertii]|nr:hypothetical protein E2P79_04910 [Aeromonas schubertii]